MSACCTCRFPSSKGSNTMRCQHHVNLWLPRVKPGNDRLLSTISTYISPSNKIPYYHEIIRNHDQSFSPIRLGVCGHIIDQKAGAHEESHLEEICKKGKRMKYRNGKCGPKSKLIGLCVHQASNTNKGVQKSRNCILKSIARALAMVTGGGGVPKKIRKQ